MKITRKLLAAVLSIVMIMSLLPLTVSAAEQVYVLDAKEHLTPMAEKTKADGDTQAVGQDNYFIIHFSEKTKIDESEKTFEDGYVSNQRLNFNGKAQVKPNGTTKNVVEFTTEGPAKVKIWWVQAGDDNRQMGIFDANGELVTKTEATVEKNKPALSTLEIPAAGKYFIGGVENKNYIFKLEVTVTVEEAPVAPAEPVKLEDGQYILSWGDLTFGALPADKGYGYPAAGSLAAYTQTDVVTIKNTADGKFTITDSLGRLVYMKGTYNSFNVGESTEGHEWILEEAGESVYYLKNVEKEKYVSYSEQYTSWGCYADKADSGKLTITAVKASEEPPVDPQPPVDSDDTGDMIGIVIALLAVSGMGITILRKKEN